MAQMSLHRHCLGDVLNVNVGSRLGKAGNPKRMAQVRAVATNETRVQVLVPLEGEVARKRSTRRLTSTRFLKPRGSSATNATQIWRRKALPCRASSGEEISESEDLDAGEEIQLDSSVFEEVYPSVRKVVKPVGSRVRGLPIPQSTFIPDDWKEVQKYLHRGKKERKQETLALQMDWAKRRASKESLTRQELEGNRRRGQECLQVLLLLVGIRYSPAKWRIWKQEWESHQMSFLEELGQRISDPNCS